MGRGLFVVVEGLDHSGKSTQCQVLAERLGNTRLMRFPDRTTKIGEEINAYLQNKANLDDKVIHQLFSKNRWEFADEIRNTLTSGTSIVCDRYAFSGVAYSGAKGLDLDWCKEPDKGLPAPDVVIFLDISPEDAKKRGTFGQERYEQADFQQKVGKVFRQLADKSFVSIDAGQTKEQVTEQIFQEIEKIKESASQQPIGSLWT